MTRPTDIDLINCPMGYITEPLDRSDSLHLAIQIPRSNGSLLYGPSLHLAAVYLIRVQWIISPLAEDYITLSHPIHLTSRT